MGDYSPVRFRIRPGLFGNRISLGFDFYNKKTKDLLLSVPFLLHSGYDRGMKNIGDMENTGYEFALNLVPVNNKILIGTRLYDRI